MGLAEKKQELLRIVENADEELTNRLIAVAKESESTNSKFTPEELQKFYASREQYHQNPETGMSLEDAHAYIRSLKQK